MDYPINLRPSGVSETSAAADAVKALRVELERTKEALGKRGPGKAPGTAAPAAPERAKPAAKPAPTEEDQAKQTERASREKEQAAAREARERANTERDKARAAANEAREAKRVEAEKVKAARDADRAAAAKIDPSLLLSQEEKARARVEKQRQAAEAKAASDAKKAETDRAAAIKQADKDFADKLDPSRKFTESQKVVQSKFFQPLMLGAAAVGASFLAAGYKLAPLALGYMGMARLNMITAQAQFNLRRLFVGVDPRPLLDAIQRTSQQILDPRTSGGAQLGGLFQRVSQGIINGLAAAEPYARAFLKGMILGALQVENGWLRLRIAIQPVLNLLPKAGLDMLALRSGSIAVHAALGLLAAGAVVAGVKMAGAMIAFGQAAVAATGPLLPAIAVILAWKAAAEAAMELQKQWDPDVLSRQLRSDLGLLSQEDRDKERNIITGDDYDKRHGLGKYAPKPAPAPEPPKATERAAAPAGKRAGDAMAAGMVQGLKGGLAAVEQSGADLAKAAERGAKTAAEIKSPSRLWEREISGNMVAGGVRGFERGADAMAAAAASVVPGASGGSAGAGGVGGWVIQQIGPFFGMPAGGEEQVRRWVFDALDDAAERLGAKVQVS